MLLFNRHLFFFYLLQLFMWSSAKYSYHKVDHLSDNGDEQAERNDQIYNQLEDSQYPQDDEESVIDKVDWIKRNPSKFQNFLLNLNSENKLKPKRQVQFDKIPSTYPEVVSNSINIPNPTPTDAVMSYGNFLNFVEQSGTAIGNNISKAAIAEQQISQLTNVTSSLPMIVNKTKETDCTRFLTSDNATAVLEKVLEELELIRKAKEGSATPDGAPCEIIGSWNSEVIGLRFDISAGNNTNELTVKLNDHNPPKRVTLMNTNWTSSGYTLKRQGGPFYLWASKNKEDVLATFTGVCKNCGNVDTIFGTWSIVHPAKDCRDLQMAIETKRDIFRKESVHIRKQEKLNKIKKNSNSRIEFV